MFDFEAIREKLLGKRIAVLVGGPSSEAEVSRRSGKNFLSAMERLGLTGQLVELGPDFPDSVRGFDLVAVMLHGTPGEDGTVQGALELLGIPYTGSDHFASSLAMDKLATKRCLVAEGVATPAFLYPLPGEEPNEFAGRVLDRFGVESVIKPRREGSSVDVRFMHSEGETYEYVKYMFKKYGPNFFAEERLPGKSVTCGVLGTGPDARALPPLELRVLVGEFYDYHAKYTKGATQFIIPPELPAEVNRLVEETAVRVHNLVGCRGFSRVDFIVHEGTPYVLEINSIPGMTELSDLPAEARAMGITYEELVLVILNSAYEK